MKLLLDTHAFLWLVDEPNKLSRKALKACRTRANGLYLSVVSAWEIQIKRHLGKLKLQSSLETVIREQQEENNLQILPIELEHVLALSNLPPYHADPFDRLLIAQSLIEKAYLVSSDRAFSKYQVNLWW